MSGVYTAIYVLSMVCHGAGCGPLDGVQTRAEMPLAQMCEFMRDAARSRSTSLTVISAECVGEAREVPAVGPRLWAQPVSVSR